MGYNLQVAGVSEKQTTIDKSLKAIHEADIQAIADAQITLEDITNLPKVIKSTVLIIAYTNDN